MAHAQAAAEQRTSRIASAAAPLCITRGQGQPKLDRERVDFGHLGAVDVTATRYEGIIHDFVMLNARRGTHAADAAMAQAVEFLRKALSTES